MEAHELFRRCLLRFAFNDAMVVGGAVRKAEEAVTRCQVFWDSRKDPSHAIRLVRTVPALQFRAFLLGRCHRQHDEPVVPALQGPDRREPRYLSHGGLFASDSVSKGESKA